MEIGSIGSSPNERKSTSVVYLVVSAAQNGQFDWFERFCVLLPNLRSFVINNFCYQTSESLPSLCLSRYYNLLICKRVARHSTHSCNIHKVSAPDSFFSFFFGGQNFFYGDHFTIESHQKATFWKSELGALVVSRSGPSAYKTRTWDLKQHSCWLGHILLRNLWSHTWKSEGKVWR